MAPQNLPTQGPVNVQASSQADPSKTGSATVSVLSDLSVIVAPATANVELGALQQFQATVLSSGNPNRAVSWSVAAAGCTGTACGMIDANGLYTAPQILPVPSSVTLTGRSMADPSKAASAMVTVTSSFTFAVSGPTSVATGAAAQFTATLTPAPNSNPSPAVIWSASGAGCSGSACGSLTSSGSYTAPSVAPSPNTVNIKATPMADPSKASSLAVTIVPVVSVAVQIAPSTATRAINHRQTFTVQVTGTSNQTVQWQVNGIPGGDPTVGQICVASFVPCQPISTTSAGSVDYLAPGSLPTQNPVTVSATSQADPSQSASAQVTILAFVVVSLSPAAVTLAPHTTQQFAAAVSGTSNQNVFWQLAGTGCSGSGSPCGVIDATGLYTAPLAPPSPNTLSVTATSAEDTSRSGSASVTIAAGANVTTLLPASVTAGAAGGFPLVAQGSGFVPSSPGPGSTILFNNGARFTTCASSNECSATLASADLAVAGSVPVQVLNSDGSTSNQVSFVIVLPATSEDVISLTAGIPSMAGKDIVVVEPSTAGTSTTQSNVNLNIVAMGLFSVVSNNCVLGGNPLALIRPASGTAAVDICAFSPSGLDPSLTYTITGPASNDIIILAKQPLGLGIVRLTLELASTTQVGPRTLFVENPNKDKSAATGALEVK